MQICIPTGKRHRVKTARTTEGSSRSNDLGFNVVERFRVQCSRTIGVQCSRTTEGSMQSNDWGSIHPNDLGLRAPERLGSMRSNDLGLGATERLSNFNKDLTEKICRIKR